MEDQVISPEKAEEAKLKARYPNLVSRPGGSDLLRKRLQKGVSHLWIVCSIFTVLSGCNVNGPPGQFCCRCRTDRPATLILSWFINCLLVIIIINSFQHLCSLKTHLHMNIHSIHTVKNMVLMSRGTIEKMIFVWRHTTNSSVQNTCKVKFPHLKVAHNPIMQ